MLWRRDSVINWGNKGGVGIAFNIGRTSFAFVNCHFDAHQHNVSKRNANFHRINRELRLQATSENSSPSRTATSSWKSTRGSLGGARRSTATAPTTIADAFDHVFWYGDLNYRINGTRRMIDRLLLHQQHAVLRFNDQLLIEMTRGNVFAGFSEGPLHFRPTYKFDKHSDAYDSSAKQRIPSWTDRVLFKSNVEDRSALRQLSYRSDMSCQISDHRPVASVFEARVILGEKAAPATKTTAQATSTNSSCGAGERERL
ncbi:hypothetical protein PINS_up011715 [Pythium insidiosum]|nr:hypothetical protein PINS_up011715 [Pythium insidiosum]